MVDSPNGGGSQIENEILDKRGEGCSDGVLLNTMNVPKHSAHC